MFYLIFSRSIVKEYLMLFIPTSQLKPNMKLDYDVMVFEGSNAMLLTKGERLTQQFIFRMQRFGIPGIYVRDDITGDILPSKPTVPLKVKDQTLTNLEFAFHTSMSSSQVMTKRQIANIEKTVQELVELVGDNPGGLINISDLRAYDEYTYHHSLSVAVLSIAIGVQLKLSDMELKKLGFAAIMHDIGKMDIPIEIINKTSKLTDEEFTIVKTHSTLSEEHLVKNRIVDPEIRESVIHHHEKVDGTGYPDNLKDEDIPFFSKIISVADVYDALTSRRPYRNPQLASEVAEYIMANCGTAFDLEIVQAMINKIEFFPVGSFVEFNTGQKAIVQNNTNPLRPVVKLLEPPFAIIDLFNDERAYSLVIRKHFEQLTMDQFYQEEESGEEASSSAQ